MLLSTCLRKVLWFCVWTNKSWWLCHERLGISSIILHIPCKTHWRTLLDSHTWSSVSIQILIVGFINSLVGLFCINGRKLSIPISYSLVACSTSFFNFLSLDIIFISLNLPLIQLLFLGNQIRNLQKLVLASFVIEIEPNLYYIIRFSFAWLLEFIKLFIENVRYFNHELCQYRLVCFLENILPVLHDHSIDTFVHLHHHFWVLPTWVQKIRTFRSEFWRETCFLPLHVYLFCDIKIIVKLIRWLFRNILNLLQIGPDVGTLLQSSVKRYNAVGYLG